MEVLVTTFSVPGAKQTHMRVNGNARAVTDMARFERMLTKQWLIENDYGEIAGLIDEVVDEWNRPGKQPRRNWWEVLAGTSGGKKRTVAGREFPVPRAAQLRQGFPITENAV